MKPITIIGGGLAGLTLGIGLRHRDVPVVIWEAGHYPRHRVCGEFINGRGLETLQRLGLRDKLIAAGARRAESAAFFSPRRQRALHILPKPALCLSRFELDDLLAREFRKLGGELKEGARWTEKNLGEGIVRASGRRPQITENGWRLFGLKVHAQNMELKADLEMHIRQDGYVGLCKLSGNRVNVCGLLRSRTPLPQLATNWKEFLRGSGDSPLGERLAAAHFDDESLCSVAGISLKPNSASHFMECAIGDAVTMIPPVTGNGMSMAFESAEMALEPLEIFSKGERTWKTTRETIAMDWDHLFTQRLRWASLSQNILTNPLLSAIALNLLGYSRFWEKVFSKTR